MFPLCWNVHKKYDEITHKRKTSDTVQLDYKAGAGWNSNQRDWGERFVDEKKQRSWTRPPQCQCWFAPPSLLPVGMMDNYPINKTWKVICISSCKLKAESFSFRCIQNIKHQAQCPEEKLHREAYETSFFRSASLPSRGSQLKKSQSHVKQSYYNWKSHVQWSWRCLVWTILLRLPRAFQFLIASFHACVRASRPNAFSSWLTCVINCDSAK